MVSCALNWPSRRRVTKRLLLLVLSTGALAATVATVAGCGGGSASSSTVGPAPRPTGAVIQRSTLSGVCVSQLSPGARPPNCKFVDVESKLRHCKVSSGGYDVAAFGISCKVTRHVFGSLQADWVYGPHAPGQALYEPWAGSGRVPHIKPTKPTGWTCWAALTPQSTVQQVCWHGEQVIVFKVA
jgi:hypothetical protein